MTKSKKQRLKDATKAHEKSNLLMLGLVVAIIIIIIYAMAS